MRTLCAALAFAFAYTVIANHATHQITYTRPTTPTAHATEQP